jgi:hypothetical protein
MLKELKIKRRKSYRYTADGSGPQFEGGGPIGEEHAEKEPQN